jgi:peptidoglycan LD-endopeptidase CwlK
MTLQEALRQNPAFPCPPEILARQEVAPVQFYSFTGELCKGEIVVDRDLAQDVRDLFALMLERKFPIESVIPMAHEKFTWDDDRSMEANNTSGFNYRAMTDSEKLSNHALGRAIDINPLLNPYIRGGVVKPEGAIYDPAQAGTLVDSSVIVRFMKDRGWTWGGDWTSLKDYQHFEKV